MGLKLVHNVVIAITPPDERPQTIVSMSVPEPGANRLTEGIAGVLHHDSPSVIRRLLIDAFSGIDDIGVNKPVQVDKAAPQGRPLFGVYLDDMIAIAEGRKVVVLDDGNPVVIDAEDAARDDLGPIGGDPQVNAMFAPRDAAGQDYMSGAGDNEGQGVVVEDRPDADKA